MKETHELVQEPLPSANWVKFLATISSIIAIGTLIALFTQNSYGQEGYQPGGRPFTNPYAPPAPGSAPAPFFDEDEEDDFEDEAFTPPPVGSAPDSGAAGAPARSGIQVGGGDSGVIEAGRSASQAAARVADDGSGGSNEVITDFNFPDADIMDIAKALGKLTGKNFILDKDVKGRITIISNSPITVRDAWRAFLTALDMNNFALIPSGSFIRIARSRDARDKQLRTYTGNFSPDSDALITRVFSLKYLSSEEVARNFRSFMPPNSRIIPYEQTNTVIVTDTGSNIAKLSKLLEILDVEGYDAGIEVINVKHAAASALAELIDKLIPGTSTGNAAGGGPRFAGGGGGRFAARKTKEGGIINTIIADERTNNLIVHANARGADQIRELIGKLDKPLPATATGGRVHVVYLQFADAEQLANTLNNLTSGGSGAASRPATSGAGAGTGVNPVQSTLFEGNIKLAADKSTNSLVITASPQDFATIQRVINRLDVPRDQVYAESFIMEVAMGKNFQFSANFFSLPSGVGSVPNGDLASFIKSPIGTSGAILGFKGGNARSLSVDGQTIPVRSVEGLIRALQSNDVANIVATPQILTLDNTEAVFESAEKIPVERQTVAANGSVQSGLDTRDVAITLKLKPSINKMSNFVKLEIDAKMEDFTNRELPSQVKQKGLATLARSVKTSVTVADGDTVVLGGLTRDSAKDTTSKVPFLGDIPVLGWLFKSKGSETLKSNLLMFITPKIVRQYESIRAILDRKLKERDDFLERNAGGVDTARPQRDSMIRSLPDLKKLQNTRPATNFSIDNTPIDSAKAGGPGFSQGAAGAAPVEPAPGALAPRAAPGVPGTTPEVPMGPFDNPSPQTELPPPPPFNEG